MSNARPLGWPRFLDQRLVVPDADALNAGQIGRHFAQTLVDMSWRMPSWSIHRLSRW